MKQKLNHFESMISLHKLASRFCFDFLSGFYLVMENLHINRGTGVKRVDDNCNDITTTV